MIDHDSAIKTRSRSWVALAVLMVGLVGCSTDGAGEPGIQVVVTTSILGDLVSEVVGADASVEVLTPLGADPHDFQPSSAQVASINAADLVVANGLFLEEGMEDVLDAAMEDGANVLEVAPRLDPLPFAGEEDHGDEDDHDDEGDHGSLDPHVWFDPLRMADAARIVAAELSAIEPAIDWVGRAETYADELARTDEQIVATLNAVDSANRRLVTNHDSLGYFADRYGFEVVATVIPGGSALADPSSEELSELIRRMEDEGVTAIFAETTRPQALADAVAAELGDDVDVVSLHTGSLGEAGSGADTLTGLLTKNAELIANALGS